MKVPFSRPSTGPAEREAACAVIDSGWLTQGPRVAEFEETFAQKQGAGGAVAVSNCTAGLHLALVLLGIGPGDEIVCPSMSFIATANAIRHAGATPVFADVDPLTYNLDPAAAAALITPRTRAILVVHQLGLPADLDAFKSLTQGKPIAVLEDAACAIGSRYKGEPIGSRGNLACFSFHPRKIVTTGEGGMITGGDAALLERARQLRQHGMTMSASDRHRAKGIVFESYVGVGYNYRLSDLQAAVGLAQLKRLDELVEARRRIARRYSQALGGHPWLRTPFIPAYAEPNYQSYAVALANEAPCSRDGLMQFLFDRGVATRRGVMLAHTESAYRGWMERGDLSDSEQASARSLLLPLFSQMSDEEADYVLDCLDRATKQLRGAAHISVA